jgi:peroxiredoxin
VKRLLGDVMSKTHFVSWLLCAVAVIARTPVPVCAAFSDDHAFGQPVAPFSAKDCWGQAHSLSDVSPDKIVVLAFVGPDCPLAQLYTPCLVRLAERYQSRGVVFFGVASNSRDSIAKISAFARKHRVPFPVLKDLRQNIAASVGATRTPEVVVLDADRRIRYRGRIDDQFGFDPNNPKASYRRESPRREDLADALDALLTKRRVAQPETAVAGCLISRDRVAVTNADVTFSRDVAPILNKHCASCHRLGEIAPFSLTSYDEAAGWAGMIAEVTQMGRMPPWHADQRYGQFANDPRLTESEKRVLERWAEAGAPLGEANDLPTPPQYIEGWGIPQPDEIHYMSERAFEVPATGSVQLMNFVVDPGWKQDRWISAIEPRPGNRSVVHHVLVYAIPLGCTIGLNPDNVFLGIYGPGLSQESLPNGFARLVRAGSRLVFNVHYTPNGSPQQDRSYVGIKFVEPGSVKREVISAAAYESAFWIPPETPSYEVRAAYAFRRDSFLLTLLPHLHLRGKDFVYTAAYPNGTREVLLSVPQYDFGWQTIYRLSEPKFMPQGTVLHCVAHYDNSEGNLNNPDPKSAVTWGERISDEMMIGFFETAPAHSRVVSVGTRPINRNNLSFSKEGCVAAALMTVNLVFMSAAVYRWLRSKCRTR